MISHGVSEMVLDEPNDANPRRITHPPIAFASMKLKGLYKNKYVYIVLSIIGIIFIWMLSIIPLLVRLIDIGDNNLQPNARGSSMTSQRNSNLTQRLPPLNLTNQENVSNIITVLCENNFIYSPNDSFCFPGCTWDPFDADIALFKQSIFITIGAAGLVVCIVTLVGWLLTCCIDWKKKRIHFDFQLARASLFVVVVCTLALLVINLIVDVLNRGVLFCTTGDGGQSFLPAHLNHYTSSDSTVKVVINLIGALYHYFTLCTLIWLSISFFNILIIIFYPLRGRESLRKRLVVFLIESLVAFVSPLLAIILAVSLDSDSPYGVIYSIQQVHVFDAWQNAVLNNWLYFFVSGIIITVAIVIVTKLRLNSLRAKGLVGKAVKLTELEKRLLLYSLVLIATLSIMGIQLVIVNSLSDGYYQAIEEYILCVTVNSAVLISLGNNSSGNSTAQVYRVNTVGGISACQRILLGANEMYPSWAYLILAVMFRVIWCIPFIILIPCCSCRFFKKKPRSSTNVQHLPIKRNVTHPT